MNKQNSPKQRLTAGALVAGLITVGTLQAGASPVSIPIQNPDFAQSTYHSLPFPYYSPTYWPAAGPANLESAYTSNYAASGGTEVGTTAVQLAGQYTGGANILTASQQTTYHAVVGDTYTLTIAVADPIYDPTVQAPLSQAGDFALTINGNIVAENLTLNDPHFGTDGVGGDPDFRKYIDGTATFTLTQADVLADPSLLNGIIGVELLTPTKSSYFFNDVRLDAVPEPSTWALMFAGLLSLIGFQRCTRKAQLPLQQRK